MKRRKSKRIKVVLDTNILISAIVFGGKSREILKQAVEGKITLAISEAIIRELSDVLSRDKFGYPSSMIRLIAGELEEMAEWVEPRERLTVILSDDDDNRILECALEAGADYLISGDNHLLEQVTYRGIQILAPSDFLMKFENL